MRDAQGRPHFIPIRIIDFLGGTVVMKHERDYGKGEDLNACLHDVSSSIRNSNDGRAPQAYQLYRLDFRASEHRYTCIKECRAKASSS